MTSKQLEKIAEFFNSIGLGDCIDLQETYNPATDKFENDVINIHFKVVDNYQPIDKVYCEHSITLRAGDNQFYCICDVLDKETAQDDRHIKNVIDAECFLY